MLCVTELLPTDSSFISYTVCGDLVTKGAILVYIYKTSLESFNLCDNYICVTIHLFCVPLSFLIYLVYTAMNCVDVCMWKETAVDFFFFFCKCVCVCTCETCFYNERVKSNCICMAACYVFFVASHMCHANCTPLHINAVQYM